MSVSLIFIFLVALLVAWLIGADSISPSFAPVASSGAIGVLRAALLAGVFGFVGAAGQGDKVAKTIGSGLLSGVNLSVVTGIIVLLIAGSLIAVGVLSHIPIPTVFVVVGSVLGAGLGLGATWNLSKLHTLAAVWVGTPFVAIFLGYVLARTLRHFVERGGTSKKLLEILLLTMGAFSAYAAGANHIGLAVGPLVDNVGISLRLLLVQGGIVVLLGAWIGGPRIVNAVSKDYSEMGVRRSICALATAAMIAESATFLGIPVSFNEAIIASMIGSGLAAGTGRIQLKKIAKTVTSWITGFLTSMGLAWTITEIFVA